MIKPTHHIFVCGSFRATGAQGKCHKKNSLGLLQYFEEEVADRELDNVMVSSTGCLQSCDEGPIVVVYPQNVWYQKVDEIFADEILDAIENDSLVAV
ncbi:ferredoxin [Achromatium sp. WMS3]|nr:ferredoxin [Achromatium sp. WMS3]